MCDRWEITAQGELEESGRSSTEADPPYRRHLTVRVPVSGGLARRCLDVMERYHVSFHALSIMRAEGRPGWREVSVVMGPCADSVLDSLAVELTA